MKKILVLIISFTFSLIVFAHTDVTKFLGFPVDGSKSEMISNLKSKGFKLNSIGDKEYLTGRFNGMNVQIFISTEKDKVSRILICDENLMNETDIKIRFNTLCQQFKNNGKYLSLVDYTISDDENISYQMNIKNKRYEAIYYQLPEGETLNKLLEPLKQKALLKYTPEQLFNPTDEIKDEIFSEGIEALFNELKNKPVWFMISEHYGKYFISMFYDNELNRAQGEDL